MKNKTLAKICGVVGIVWGCRGDFSARTHRHPKTSTATSTL